MEGFLIKTGIISIVFLIIFAVKKIEDYFYYKRSNGFEENPMHVVDEKVFKAARAFAQRASDKEIRELLLKCLDFDEEDIDEILSLSKKHKLENDGGYSSFLKAVNKILGEEVYCRVCA